MESNNVVYVKSVEKEKRENNNAISEDEITKE